MSKGYSGLFHGTLGSTFDKSGVVEVGTISNKIDAKHKKALMDLFGGGSDD